MIRQAQYFALYVFDTVNQRYERIAVIKSKGLVNLIVAALPYDHLYVIPANQSKPYLHKYNGLKLTQVK
jgi:hypothetical protein